MDQKIVHEASIDGVSRSATPDEEDVFLFALLKRCVYEGRHKEAAEAATKLEDMGVFVRYGFPPKK